MIRHSLSVSFSVKRRDTISSGFMRNRISSWTRPEPRTPPPMRLAAKSTCTQTHNKHSTVLWKKPSCGSPVQPAGSHLKHTGPFGLDAAAWRDVQFLQLLVAATTETNAFPLQDEQLYVIVYRAIQVVQKQAKKTRNCCWTVEIMMKTNQIMVRTIFQFNLNNTQQRRRKYKNSQLS